MPLSNFRTPLELCFALGLVLLPTTFAHAQRNLTDIPEPDPVAELAAMRIHELAEVNLFAADPDFVKPIQINFDSSGALWIASSEVYPQIKPGEVANDKIIVLRDSDGDGVSDQRTVFADGLLIPTGVIPVGPHAAYVAESTRLLYLEDTDHDGKADKKRIVLSGFGTEDTHHLVHTLRFGPDGCLYFNQSIYIHSHIQTPYGTKHLDGGGIWRYRPATGRLEIVCKGFVNPWGHVFDAVGESFATDGAYFEGINYVFPDSVFVTSPGAKRFVKGLNPGSPKHCGLEVLSGTHIPESWHGDLVTNDFRSHRVCRFTVKPNRSGYVSRQQPELIATQHVAFRPIDVRMGPDGAIYVADWYNPIIQHGEVDFRDERRDREHGRIWRISFPGRPLDPWPEFETLNPEQLLGLLEDPAFAVRQFARQSLWDHLAESPQETMVDVNKWADVQPQARNLERSWLQEVAGEENDSRVNLLANVPLDANRTYLRSLWRRREQLDSDQRVEFEKYVVSQTTHEDPRVRLEAVVCAGQLNANRHPAALLGVLQAAQMETDPNLDFAIWQSIRLLDRSYEDGSLLAVHDWRDKPEDLARAVSAIGTVEAAETATTWLEENTDAPSLVNAVSLAGDADQLGRVVRALIAKESVRLEQLQPILERTKRDGTLPSDVAKALAEQAPRWLEQPESVAKIAAITGAWRVTELEPALLRAVDQSNGPARQQVIQALGAFDSDAARSALQKLASHQDPATRVSATASIAARRPKAAVPLIVKLFDDAATADAATNLIAGQMNRKEMPERFASAISERELDADRARELLRRVRVAGGNAALEEAIQTAGQLASASWKLTPALQRDILAKVSDQGNAQRGQTIYRREKLQCIQCHAIGTGGGLVGPNLISIGGSSQPDYILESLLNPSAKLKEGYTTLSVLTVDGEIANGIVISRTEQAVRLRLADGKEIELATDDIEQEKPGKSLMPEGLLDSLTKTELVDLTAFLVALGRDPDFTVSTEPVVRQLETLVYSNEANRRLNRTSTDTAASDDPLMKWRAITTLVDGSVPVNELDMFKQHRETPPTSFVRFRLKLPADGKAVLTLPTEGIDAWVDGQPTPVWDLKSLSLKRGEHQVVLAIDRDTQPRPFKIQVDGEAVTE